MKTKREPLPGCRRDKGKEMNRTRVNYITGDFFEGLARWNTEKPKLELRRAER